MSTQDQYGVKQQKRDRSDSPDSDSTQSQDNQPFVTGNADRVKRQRIDTSDSIDSESIQPTVQLQLFTIDNGPRKDIIECSSHTEDADENVPVAEAPPIKVAVKSVLGTNYLKHLKKLNVVLKDSPERGTQLLYREQAVHSHTCLVGGPRAQEILVYITGKVRDAWKGNIMKAINCIRIAAPGINIEVEPKYKRKAKIEIDQRIPVNHKDSIDLEAFTDGNIWYTGIARIHLGENYARNFVEKHMDLFKPGTTPQEAEEQTMLTTCIHELLHALGYGHEHQTECNAEMVNDSDTRCQSDQVKVLRSIVNLTRFDPHSIMLYPNLSIKDRNTATCTVSSSRTSYNLVMSELDKVTLNIIYPPCACENSQQTDHSAYKPKEFECAGTNMFYCFRNVMESHNYPYDKICNGVCGGDLSNPSGPNCPACRTLKSKKSFLNDKSVTRWQGWSGMIYCGRTNNGHSCGPDNGFPCNECKALIDPK